MSSELANILATGITELNVSVATDIQHQLIEYLKLLHKWNKVYNLTSVRNTKEIVSVHLLDSLAILPYINGQKIIDVGTGAGLPGLVLALCFPDKQFVLIDSNSKKTRFIKQAVTELEIQNVLVEHCRIEALQCETSFDQIVSRAYTSLQTFIKSTCHLARIETEYLAMKGQLPESEIREIEDEFSFNSIPLKVPNIEGQRHIIIMTSK